MVGLDASVFAKSPVSGREENGMATEATRVGRAHAQVRAFKDGRMIRKKERTTRRRIRNYNGTAI
jgi:hypothetical protein